MTDQHDDDEEEKSGGGIQLELIKSYLSFLRRAVRLRRWLAFAVFAAGIGLTVLAYKYFPRTFNCTTTLMAEQSQVLDTFGQPPPLAGAASLVLRHENLEALVRETNLVEKFEQRRPPLLKLKDKLLALVVGEYDMDTKVSIQVGTLENRLQVFINGAGNLNISVDWTDPLTAAEVAEAARESFLRSRHSAETSAFQEKLTILEGHASKLRQEVETLAEQIDVLSKRKLEQERARMAAPVAAGVPPTAAPSLPRSATRRLVVDEQLPSLREKLSTQKQKLAALEAERESRIREERRKLEELKLRLTPNHPEVVTQERRINVISQPASELALLRSEVTNLEGEIRQREAMGRVVAGGPFPGPAAGTTPGAEPLPTEILQTMQREDVDPVLAQQLSGAAVKYGVVRDDIRSTRIALDTAQAAFNHRYRVVVPADPPRKPYKPNPLLIFGGGLFVTLLLALGLPLLAELRTGIMVERWQVQMVELPVLAELRLPPHSGD